MWLWGEVLAELVPGGGGAVSWVPRSAMFQSQEAKRPAKPSAGSGRSPGRGWEQDVTRGTDVALRPFFRSPGLCSSPANSHASRMLSPQHLHADTDEYQPGPLVPCAPQGAPPQGYTGSMHCHMLWSPQPAAGVLQTLNCPAGTGLGSEVQNS